MAVKGGRAVGVEVDGQLRAGFPTPSRKLEFYSKTLKDWKWPEHAVPTYARSHVHWREMDRAAGEMALLPTFRLPTLIHSRSGHRLVFDDGAQPRVELMLADKKHLVLDQDGVTVKGISPRVMWPSEASTCQRRR